MDDTDKDLGRKRKLNDVTNENAGNRSVNEAAIGGVIDFIKADEAEQVLRWLDLHSLKLSLPLPYHKSTALQMAVANNAHQTVELLLQMGANANAIGLNGDTALHLAVKQDNPYLSRLLLKNKANINITNTKGKTALALARSNRAITNLLRLDGKAIAKIDRCNKHGETHLHKYAEIGDRLAVQTEINMGANVNAQCNAGHTPLHKAALEGHADVAELLIKAGASLNLQNQDGDTALHDASANHHLDVINLLLDSGADPRIGNLVGDLPRDRVLEYNGEDGPEIVKIFDVATQNLQRSKAPIRNQHVSPTLLERSRRNSADSRADSPSFGRSPTGNVTRIDRRNPTPNSHLYDDPKYKYKNGSGKMMVHTSIEHGNVDALASLLEQGADRTVRDKAKRTPLHYASRAGDVEIARMLIEFYPSPSKTISVQEVEAAVREQVNAVNTKLETPLHEAVGRFHPNMIEYLLEVGANPNTTDDKGLTPLEKALTRGLGENDPDVLLLKRVTKATKLEPSVTKPSLGLVTPESDGDVLPVKEKRPSPHQPAAESLPVKPTSSSPSSKRRQVLADGDRPKPAPLSPRISRSSSRAERNSLQPKESVSQHATKPTSLRYSPAVSPTSTITAFQPKSAIQPAKSPTLLRCSPVVSPTSTTAAFLPPKTTTPPIATPRKPILRISNLTARYQPSVTSSRYKSPLPIAGVQHESILEYFPTPGKLDDRLDDDSPTAATHDSTMAISNLLN